MKVNKYVKGKNVKVAGSTHKDLKHFQDFLYRHF